MTDETQEMSDPEPKRSFSETCNYGKMNYWDARYMNFSSPFEWYCGFADIEDIITRYCPKDANVLIAGSGNSLLSKDMCDRGYSFIRNIDFSRVVIDQMKMRYKKYADIMKWEQMNCIDMLIDDNAFDCVIDKGTLDSIFCTDDVEIAVKRYCSEVERVLKPHGVWIVISCGAPEVRLELFENDDVQSDNFMSFDCTVFAIEKPLLDNFYPDEEKYFYVYVCKKDEVKAKQKRKKKAMANSKTK
uniref:Methyltransferase type 11 domain-containing protein n=1 Tax=Ditylum brightwellii TaxID=49249 RepID=A0A7S1Z5D5_9STRA|mmetsp:Transcript_24785/g.36926  ORF Transcript_24785/g.36926 Transcript_24785/m.36926 type:complete len:244 (+) Transcript_24785:121-852(+)